VGFQTPTETYILSTKGFDFDVITKVSVMWCIVVVIAAVLLLFIIFINYLSTGLLIISVLVVLRVVVSYAIPLQSQQQYTTSH